MGSKAVPVDHAFDDVEPSRDIAFDSAIIAGLTACPLCGREITREGGKAKCENCKVEAEI